MPFCSHCGAEVQGNFCAKCGASAAVPAGATATPPPPTPPPPVPAAQGLADNVAALLCYLPWLGILIAVVFLVVAPYSQNRALRFHALQSIFMNLAFIVIFITISVVSVIILPIPFLGPAISLVLHLADFLGYVFLCLMMLYKAYNNERWVLPVIGPLAEKQV
jgi:uncharacterized membrane protein